ncbi:MAG TPA: hypothetical protein VFH00_01280, partial [Candidatus Nitrosotalea sp.]|nr:hypothetical protein [Candidatus Nitrosotalea sp.]
MAPRDGAGRRPPVTKLDAASNVEKTSKASPGAEAQRPKTRKRDDRERLTRLRLEEQARLAYSDASK